MIAEPTFSLGPIMKAARKFKRFNQADVAKAIGCSQSALSKMEHNLLIPSAPQWFLFSRFTAIPPETLESGIIHRHNKIKFNNDQVSLGFKIPKKYRTSRSMKVRELYPFLSYAEKKLDDEVIKNFLGTLQIDNEFYIDFDNLVNFELMVEFLNFFEQHKLGTEEHIKHLIDLGHNELYWGHVNWKKFSTLEEVLRGFIDEQIYHQVDFKLQLENLGDRFVLNFSPETHLTNAKMPSPEALDILRIYRKLTIEEIVQKAIGKRAQVISDRATNNLKGRFEIS